MKANKVCYKQLLYTFIHSLTTVENMGDLKDAVNQCLRAMNETELANVEWDELGLILDGEGIALSYQAEQEADDEEGT